MAITSVGYAGTVSDAQWAQMARFTSADRVVRDVASFAVTQNGATRGVNVAAGVAMGAGIMDTSNAVTALALDSVVPGAGTGQWYAIALHRNWATKTTDLVSRKANASTSSTPPTGSNLTFPTNFTKLDGSAITATPGTEDDHLLFYAWVNGDNTTMVLVDAREVAPITVSSYANLAATTGVKGQRARVFADPIAARNGWYVCAGGTSWLATYPGFGVIPASIGISSGSYTIANDGTIRFTGASGITLDGVFDTLSNTYEVLTRVDSVNTGIKNWTLRSAGAAINGGTYLAKSTQYNGTAASQGQSYNAGTTGGYMYFYPASAATTGVNTGSQRIEVFNPATATATHYYSQAHMDSTNNAYDWQEGGTLPAGAVDGISPNFANFTGSIKIIRK